MYYGPAPSLNFLTGYSDITTTRTITKTIMPYMKGKISFIIESYNSYIQQSNKMTYSFARLDQRNMNVFIDEVLQSSQQKTPFRTFYHLKNVNLDQFSHNYVNTVIILHKNLHDTA